MKKINCKLCGKPIKKGEESRHSPEGKHFFPYVFLHESCHKKFHNENLNWRYCKLNLKWLRELKNKK